MLNEDEVVKFSTRGAQDVNAALAAISVIIHRTDITAKEKCSAMAAVCGVDLPPPPTKEQAARQLVWDVWSKTDGRCTYCDVALNPFDRNARNGYHMDHVNPRAAGGPDDLDNLTPACSRCNYSKYARTPEQWRGQ